MNIFELLFTQPIFNLLLFLYGIIPGGDLGVAVIIFTIIIRLLMWPLVKKQLHQSKLIRDLQPQLAIIRKKAKGNKQLEAQMSIELYKERGINPLAPFGLILLQLPIFLALFSAINIIANDRGQITRFAYDFMDGIPGLRDVLANPMTFNETFLGVIDLTKSAINSTGWSAALLFVVAIITAIVQYYQSKQLTPQPKDRKRLRDLLRDQAAGKNVDQAEVMAATTGRILFLIPVLMFFGSIWIAGALALYLLASTVTGYIQQQFVLGKDTEELEDAADEASQKPLKKKKQQTVTEDSEDNDEGVRIHRFKAEDPTAATAPVVTNQPANMSKRAKKAQNAKIVKKKHKKKR